MSGGFWDVVWYAYAFIVALLSPPWKEKKRER